MPATARLPAGALASAYGITLTASQPIPGLEGFESGRPAPAPELNIVLGRRAAWAPASAQPAAALEHHDCGDGRHRLRYPDGTAFDLDLHAATIWAAWSEPLTLEDTATYLLGPVLGFYLRLRGLVCLHGSVAVLGGRAVAFVGPAGAGKSTLAAALALTGTPILTEDVACLDESTGAFAVRPGYPRIRLWPGSPGSSEPLPRLTPNWDKEYLPLGDAFHARAAPLGAVYLLEPRGAMAPPAQARELPGQAALSGLIANTYGRRLLDLQLRAHEFEVLGRLARTVPVRALTLNADGTRLAEACDWIRRRALA